MKQRNSWSWRVPWCLAVGVFAFAGHAADEPPMYEVVELPVPAGWDRTVPQAINDAGEVALVYQRTGVGDTRSFVWADGVLTPLGEFGQGFIRHEASSLNESGQVSGSSWAGGFPAAAWQWDDGVFTSSDTLGGANAASFCINESGQMGGWSLVSSPASSFTWFAFIWDNGTMTNLGTLPESVLSDAMQINDAGQIVGNSTPTGGSFFRGVIADTTMGMHNLGTLGGLESMASGINNLGQVVGSSHTGPLFDDQWWVFHAFLWQDGVMVDLGTLPGDDFSSARQINDAGDAVGWSRLGFFDAIVRATLWHDGAAYDLNDRIPAGSGWILQYAANINSSGQIIGTGLLDGEIRGFVLTPGP
jgi:probable HAF family extracellular repeat protein